MIVLVNGKGTLEEWRARTCRTAPVPGGTTKDAWGGFIDHLKNNWPQARKRQDYARIEIAFWGTLGGDPELKTAKSGNAFAVMNVAVTVGKDDTGKDTRLKERE